MNIENTKYEGMYVKLYNGKIGKIINSYWRNKDIGKWHFNLENKDTHYNEYGNVDIFENTEPSPNIIDLIEVGDYVNGYLVYSGGKKHFDYILIWDNEKDYYIKAPLNVVDIKTIVTKEQFSSMEYKINE